MRAPSPCAGTLKEVAASGARAGEEAAVALIRAALRNNSLQLLDIRGVPLGAEVRVGRSLEPSQPPAALFGAFSAAAAGSVAGMH